MNFFKTSLPFPARFGAFRVRRSFMQRRAGAKAGGHGAALWDSTQAARRPNV
jgi:hypothetical protein